MLELVASDDFPEYFQVLLDFNWVREDCCCFL